MREDACDSRHRALADVEFLPGTALPWNVGDIIMHLFDIAQRRAGTRE